MTIDLAAIKARTEKARKGPWRFPSWEEDPDPAMDGYASIAECDVMEPTGIQHANEYDGYWHDWRFIQHSRTDVPALVSLVEKIARLACMHGESAGGRFYAIRTELESAGITAEVVAGLENTHD